MIKVKKKLGVKKKEVPSAKKVLNDFPFDTLTNSARSTFLNCRKKFYWQYIKRLSPIKPAMPLLVGGLVHDGLERFYSKEGLDLDEYQLIVQQKLNEQLAFVSKDEDASKLMQQEALVMGILNGYVKRYSKQDKTNWVIKAPETEFCFDIPGSTLKNAGKRDLLVNSKKDKSLILVEHKTTARLDPGYLAKLPLDNQILGYAYSCLVDEGELPKHIVYNVMQKLGIRLKQNETLQQFYDRMKMEYEYNLESMFYREIVPINKKQVMQYIEELSMMAQEISRCIETGFFYMNTTQCTQYGTCPYMPLCTKQKDAEYLYVIRESTHAELSSTESDS